jgi:hypothetical protein
MQRRNEKAGILKVLSRKKIITKKISGKVNSKQIKKRIDSLQTSGQKPLSLFLSLSLSLSLARQRKKKSHPDGIMSPRI